MAFCDYHPCDCCGAHKTFYDADMLFGHDANGALVYSGYFEGDIMVNGYRAYALCHECAKTHVIEIIARSASNVLNQSHGGDNVE